MQQSNSSWPPSRAKLIRGAVLGAAIGTLLPFLPWFAADKVSVRALVRMMAEASLAAILASRSVKALCMFAKNLEITKAEALQVANERALEAASIAAAAAVNVTLAEDTVAAAAAAAKAAEQSALVAAINTTNYVSSTNATSAMTGK